MLFWWFFFSMEIHPASIESMKNPSRLFGYTRKEEGKFHSQMDINGFAAAQVLNDGQTIWWKY